MKIIVVTIFSFMIFCSGFLPAKDSGELLSFEELEKETLYFSAEQAAENPARAYRLCLGGRGLSELSIHVSLLHNLQYLNAAQNHLTALPNFFCNLQYLQEINFAGNDIKELPSCITFLRHLKHIDFSANPNINWEKEISTLSELPELTELDLSMNEIKKFPEDFSFPQLKMLVLTGNDFSEEEKKRIQNKLEKVNIIF